MQHELALSGQIHAIPNTHKLLHKKQARFPLGTDCVLANTIEILFCPYSIRTIACQTREPPVIAGDFFIWRWSTTAEERRWSHSQDSTQTHRHYIWRIRKTLILQTTRNFVNIGKQLFGGLSKEVKMHSMKLVLKSIQTIPCGVSLLITSPLEFDWTSTCTAARNTEHRPKSPAFI